MRSDEIKTGVERTPNRSLLYALGYTDEELSRPLIGVVSSYNEIVPGHMGLDKIAEAVKAGVRAAGGTPVMFPGHRRVRRNRYGPCGYEVFAGEPRPHCRLHRGYGHGPPVRWTCDDSKLRQKCAGFADGGGAAEYPHHLLLRRPHAGGPPQRWPAAPA